MQGKGADNEIVHVALVIDASGSMRRLESKVVDVVDEQIRELKKLSEELDLETRVSVYRFSYASDIECIIFDRDVFRLPSIAGLYRTSGQTALIDAALKSQTDLAQTAQMYGKHHFRTYVWTDGGENDSRSSGSALRSLLERQGANWSIACLVPDENGKRLAENYGFPAANVLVWDVSSAGLVTATRQVTEATQSFMTTVSQGGTYDKTNVFGTGADKVNAQTVQALTEITPGSFVIWEVTADERIDDFVRRNNKGVFNVGRGYYPLLKREKIQSNKDVLILEKATGKLYGGFDAVRQLLHLPKGVDVTVTPDANPDYTIFVKSTANNRKLLKGWKLVYLR